MIRKRDTSHAIERIETGVNNLDQILGGGLPKTSVTVISGPPGSGKTILAHSGCGQGIAVQFVVRSLTTWPPSFSAGSWSRLRPLRLPDHSTGSPMPC